VGNLALRSVTVSRVVVKQEDGEWWIERKGRTVAGLVGSKR